MKIKKGFVLREICGENVVSAEGLDHVNFNRLISLNPTATYLWKNVYDKDFDEDLMAILLTDKYDVDYQAALIDAKELVKVWKENGLVE